MAAKRLALGFGTGVLVGGLFILVVGFFMVNGERDRVRRGWSLEYIVTAASPIEAGTILDMEMIQQQPVPEQFITGSVVRPHELSEALDLRVRGDMEPGDPLLWFLLEAPRSPTSDAEEMEDSGESEADSLPTE